MLAKRLSHSWVRGQTSLKDPQLLFFEIKAGSSNGR